jgi:outer membrane lipoprotein carrier protein
MRKLTLGALVLWLACATTPAQEAGPLLSGLQRWLDGTKDLQARFEQTLLSSALGAGPKESGRVFLRRPGRMRWEYTTPETKIALLVDDRTELYLAEEKPPRLHRAQLSPDDAPLAALLAGTQPVDTVFTAAVLPDEEGRKRLKLVPRSASSGVQEIVLGLDPASSAVLRVEVLDQGGNRMGYAFSGLKRNAGIADAAFRIKTPAGTEVVDGL